MVPDDVLGDIIVRLPPTSILRFRCVSRHWNRLISDIKPRSIVLVSILVRLPTKSLLRFRCLSREWNRLISIYVKSRARKRILLRAPTPLAFSDDTIVMLNFPPRPAVTIGGSVNGIVLLVDEYVHDAYRSALVLYNPFTGASNTLPHPLPCHGLENRAYGFGYGTGTPDDLKIVKFRIGRNGYDLEVLSLKEGSWNWNWPRNTITVGSLRGVGIWDRVGKFVDGFLYWLSHYRKPPDMWVIVALDVKEMVASKIDPPSDCQPMRPSCLGILHGRLCMVHVEDNDWRQMVVWVMKEQGSWSLAFSVNLPLDLTPYPLKSTSVICIPGDGRILVTATGCDRIYMYDSNRSSYSYSWIFKSMNLNTSRGSYHADLYRIQGIEYVESLVMP